MKISLWLCNFGLLTALLSCGSSSPNALLFSSKADKERIESLYAEGRTAYDNGQFDKAIEKLKKAYDLNPNYEKVAQELAFAYLGKAGFDMFSTAKKMMDLDKQNKATGTSSDAAGALSGYSILLNLTSADQLKMGTLVSSDNPFFKDLDVIHPKDPGVIEDADSVRSVVDTLRYVNQAMMTICPFVDSALWAGDSTRFGSCKATNAQEDRPSQSHLIFGIAAMIEAISFNTILLYSGSSSSLTLDSSGLAAAGSSNLEKRAAAMNQKTFTASQIADYSDAVTELQSDISAVLNTSATSMLSATLIDLRLAVNAFKQIAGMPQSVTDSLNGGLKTLEKGAVTAGESAGSFDGQLATLRQQMTGTVITQLKTSIKTALAQSGVTAEQKKAVCDAYTTITTGTTAASEKPTGC